MGIKTEFTTSPILFADPRTQTRETCAPPEVVIFMPSVSDFTEPLHSMPVEASDCIQSRYIPEKTNGWIPKMMVWKRWIPLKFGHFWYLRFLGFKIIFLSFFQVLIFRQVSVAD